MSSKKLVVAGGGAAGFFCAVNAARMNPELKVIILEKSGKLLSKVKVSGGGRCNITHFSNDIREMAAGYPRGGNFLRKTFHEFFVTDTIEWFRGRKVLLRTEEDNRMFPVTNSSQTVVDCLLQEAEKFGVEIILHAELLEIEKDQGKFRLIISGHRRMEADFLCIASGGYSKASQFEYITQLGHSIEPPVPSLFTFNIPGNPITALKGISVETADVRIADSPLKQDGPILITHWGLSGPAILKLSAWGARELAARNYQFDIVVNWIPSCTEQSLNKKMQEWGHEFGSRRIMNRSPMGLPQRLWEFAVRESGIADQTRWAELQSEARSRLCVQCCAQKLTVRGKTTFKEEFVTAGGIRLGEIHHHTMESKLIPNLYFAGEVMDVDGITGGYNFQHAWTSGWIAAREIANKSRND